MRQTISGLVAAVAVMIAGAAPAMACGDGCRCARRAGYAEPVRAAGMSRRSAYSSGYGRLRRLAATAAGPIERLRRVRCSSITTSTRARPIPVRAPSRRSDLSGRRAAGSRLRRLSRRPYRYGYVRHGWHRTAPRVPTAIALRLRRRVSLRRARWQLRTRRMTHGHALLRRYY